MRLRIVRLLAAGFGSAASGLPLSSWFPRSSHHFSHLNCWCALCTRTSLPRAHSLNLTVYTFSVRTFAFGERDPIMHRALPPIVRQARVSPLLPLASSAGALPSLSHAARLSLFATHLRRVLCTHGTGMHPTLGAASRVGAAASIAHPHSALSAARRRPSPLLLSPSHLAPAHAGRLGAPSHARSSLLSQPPLLSSSSLRAHLLPLARRFIHIKHVVGEPSLEAYEWMSRVRI
jgi:hypothetical protein